MIMLFIATLAFAALAINPSLVGSASAILSIILVLLGRREHQTVNPYFLFLSTPISLLLYSDSVSSTFLPAMDLSVQVLIIGGIFAYLAGMLTVNGGRSAMPTANPPSYSFNAILALGLAPHLAGIATVGIPLLAADVNAARASYLLPIFGQFTIFLPVTMLIAFQKRNKPLILVSVVTNVFFSFIVASKFSVMFTGLFFFYAYFRYGGRTLFKINPAYLVIFALLGVPFLFDAIFTVRENTDQIAYAWRRDVMFQSVFLDLYGDYTYLPYLYLTAPWSNFYYVVELHPEWSYGARSLYSMISVFQLDSFFITDERPIRAVQFNTHAYLSDFYLDFGVYGVVFFSYFLGVLVKLTYINALKKRDVLSESVWICFAFASFMLFFSNHFTGLTYPILSFIFFNLYRAISQAAMHRHR